MQLPFLKGRTKIHLGKIQQDQREWNQLVDHISLDETLRVRFPPRGHFPGNNAWCKVLFKKKSYKNLYLNNMKQFRLRLNSNKSNTQCENKSLMKMQKKILTKFLLNETQPSSATLIQNQPLKTICTINDFGRFIKYWTISFTAWKKDSVQTR